MGYSPQESLENRINTMGTPNFPLIHRVPFIQKKISSTHCEPGFFFTTSIRLEVAQACGLFRGSGPRALEDETLKHTVRGGNLGDKKNTEIWTRLIWLRLVDILDTRIMCIYIYISVSDCSWWWCQIFGAWNELERQIAALMEFQRIKLRMQQEKRPKQCKNPFKIMLYKALAS